MYEAACVGNEIIKYNITDNIISITGTHQGSQKPSAYLTRLYPCLPDSSVRQNQNMIQLMFYLITAEQVGDK